MNLGTARNSPRTLVPVPIDPVSFRPFGQYVHRAAGTGRQDCSEDLASTRAGARPCVFLTSAEPVQGPDLRITEMERHEFSSQTFIHVSGSRWLIVVCPSDGSGGPDIAAALAFMAGPGDVITYKPDTWHHSLTVLDEPSCHAVVMWRDGSRGDEEFRPVEPFHVSLA